LEYTTAGRAEVPGPATDLKMMTYREGVVDWLASTKHQTTTRIDELSSFVILKVYGPFLPHKHDNQALGPHAHR
jgi:hypothetical protein